MAVDVPLHSQLYETLKGRILSGEWGQGDRVPSERKMVEEFGVSRGTVRQALAALRAEGFVLGGIGSSPRVQRVVPSQSFDTFVSFTEWARSLGKEPGQRVIEISRRIAEPSEAEGLGLDPGDTIVEVLRVRLFDDEPVMLESAVYPLEVGQRFLVEDLERVSMYQILREEGMAPVRAHNVIGAEGAGERESHWLGVSEGSALLRVRRTSYDVRGNILELATNRYLPSMATFTVDNAVDATASGLVQLSRSAVAH